MPAAAVASTLAAAGIERSRLLTLVFNGESRRPETMTRGDAAATAAASRAHAPAAARAVPSDLDILETTVTSKAIARPTADADATDRLAG
jgi:hypothetical protein